MLNQEYVLDREVGYLGNIYSMYSGCVCKYSAIT